MSSLEERMNEIVDLPLGHLETLFRELGAGMTKAADSAERESQDGDMDADEKFAQIIIMTHGRGIATGMDLAATEIAKARALIRSLVEDAS